MQSRKRIGDTEIPFSERVWTSTADSRCCLE